MNYLKDFLEELTKDGRYYAETIDNMAEIYVDGETKPVVMLEFDGSVYHLNFRCDVISRVVAQITYDMTVIDEDIIIGPDFYSTPDAGLIYGEQALAMFFASVVHAFNAAQEQQEAELTDAIYVVEQPIYGYGHKNDKDNRVRRLWKADLE